MLSPFLKMLRGAFFFYRPIFVILLLHFICLYIKMDRGVAVKKLEPLKIP